MGAHHRKSKAGHLRLSRAERDYLDTCVHEAAHAIIGIANCLKLSDSGVFAYDPRYPADRFNMKMTRRAGATTWNKRSYEEVHERWPIALVQMGMAPEVHLESLPWIDKHLLGWATSNDKKQNEMLLSTIHRDGLDAFDREMMEEAQLQDPAGLSRFYVEALLTRPSIKAAISEVAKRLHEKRRLFDAEVREILIRSVEQHFEDDLEYAHPYVATTEELEQQRKKEILAHRVIKEQWLEVIKGGGVIT